MCTNLNFTVGLWIQLTSLWDKIMWNFSIFKVYPYIFLDSLMNFSYFFSNLWFLKTSHPLDIRYKMLFILLLLLWPFLSLPSSYLSLIIVVPPVIYHTFYSLFMLLIFLRWSHSLWMLVIYIFSYHYLFLSSRPRQPTDYFIATQI